MKKISELKVSDKMQLKIIRREMSKYRREYLENLKINDPKAYEKMIQTRREYDRNWNKKHPDYNKLWLREWNKKHPEKQREYQRRYWLKRAKSRK